MKDLYELTTLLKQAEISDNVLQHICADMEILSDSHVQEIVLDCAAFGLMALDFIDELVAEREPRLTLAYVDRGEEK